MKQSRLFPPALISLTAIVIVSVSHFSAAVASWDDIYSPGNCYYDSLDNWGDNSTAPMLDLDKFNTLKILWTTDSVKLFRNPDEINGQDIFHGISINEIFHAMPDELLTLRINSQASIPDQSFEWNSDEKPSSEPADDMVFKNNGDYIKSMRTPAPTSLLLVAIGLISLRYTRWLRL